jgi:hypothetical protein
VQPATPQRPSFTFDADTTAPGTLEVELGGAASGDAMPARHVQVHAEASGVADGLEVNVSADLVAGASGAQFGERLGVGLRRALHRGPSGRAVALAGGADIRLRGSEPSRLAAGVAIVQRVGLGALVGKAVAGAPLADGSEAGSTLTLLLGYARSVADGSRVTPFGEAQLVPARRGGPTLSLMQGASVRLRPHLVLDMVGRASSWFR